MLKNYRRYQRYSVWARAMIRRLNAESQEGVPTEVNTISQGGMGFYTDVLMEKATPVSVEFLFGALQGIEKGIVTGKIASICSQERDYFVGIAFDTEISYDHFVEIIG
ncbi:MAG TPA: PilZ domain-containing protein [Thermodesulfovibrionales bacterium]|nr:PilZ domain-containing protein [Thermodesulfovibrionales bacterium]